MLATSPPCRRRTIAGAFAAVAVGFPATAFGADTGGPNVIRINPSTGARTVLASSSSWNRLNAIAVGRSGTIYIAVDSKRSGVYSLTGPKFEITPLATTSPTSDPYGLASSGRTLYTVDTAGLLSIDTTSPFTQKLVAPQGDAKALRYIAASGSTVYGTPFGRCSGPTAKRGAAVVAIDAAGSRRDVADLPVCPEDPRGIAVAPDGTLVVATATKIFRVNPADGSSTTLSQGGLLSEAIALAVTSSGDVIVADFNSGVLRISPSGKQSTIASGGDLKGVNTVALDAAGTIYVTAPPAQGLQISAPSRQRFSASRGIRISVGCRPDCGLSYRVKVAGVTYDGRLEDKHGNVLFMGVRKTRYLTLDAKTNRRIAKALSRQRSVKVTLSATPEDDHTEPLEKPTTLTVRLVR